MARITVEDCLTKETNRFALVQLASKRTKQLLTGGRSLLTEDRGNKSVVNALREIASGRVRFMTAEEERIAKEQEALEAERAKLAQQSASPVIASGGSGTGGSGDDENDVFKPSLNGESHA